MKIVTFKNGRVRQTMRLLFGVGKHKEAERTEALTSTYVFYYWRGFSINDQRTSE
jgi:hypothetical protein